MSTKKIQKWIDNMWPLTHKYSMARNNGYLLESIVLLYYLILYQLRAMLTLSSIGEDQIPLSPKNVEDEGHLRGLTNLAVNRQFLDEALSEKILKFNNQRNKAIHKMLDGKISYDELEDVVLLNEEILSEIQNKWLPISVGQEVLIK